MKSKRDVPSLLSVGARCESASPNFEVRIKKMDQSNVTCRVSFSISFVAAPRSALGAVALAVI